MSEHLPESVDINNNKLSLHYYPGYLNEDRCEHLIDRLTDLTYDDNSQVFVYGKWMRIPRKQTAFGDTGISYRFSGTEVPARAWTPFLQDLANEITEYLRNRNLLPDDCAGINFVLVNYYEDGNSYIGWHADDERDLASSVIVSLSLGAARDFIFRKKSAHEQKYKMHLSNGDMLVMHGDTQKYWQHTLPKRMHVTEPRWNLTFRIMWKN